MRFRPRVKALDRMDGLVGAGLESFGLAVSATVLQELHVASTI